MIGFILAAGFGTRLKPLTDHIPKALVPVCGKPLLLNAYDFFRMAGVSQIAINAHYLHYQVAACIRENGLQATLFHEQGKIRGTGGALYFAKEFLASDDVFCVANADIIAQVNLPELLAKFTQQNMDAGLVTADPQSKGTMLFDTVTKEYKGTVGDCEPATGARGDFIGIALYRKKFLSVLTEADFSIIPVWKRAQEQGMKVGVLEAGQIYWNDLGTPEKLAQIHFDVLDKKYSLAMPDNLYVDLVAKKTYPKQFTKKQISRLGEYTWWEPRELPDVISISHSVVFENAIVDAKIHYKNCILTKFGALSFDN